jgi:hypothetical protein
MKLTVPEMDNIPKWWDEQIPISTWRAIAKQLSFKALFVEPVGICQKDGQKFLKIKHGDEYGHSVSIYSLETGEFVCHGF